MKKSILNLDGIAVLTKTQQKNTFGGLRDPKEGIGGNLNCYQAQYCQHIYNANGILTGISVTTYMPDSTYDPNNPTSSQGTNNAYPCGWQAISPRPSGC